MALGLFTSKFQQSDMEYFVFLAFISQIIGILYKRLNINQKKPLFGDDKWFFEESAELEPRLLNELKGNSLIVSQQPLTKGGGG